MIRDAIREEFTNGRGREGFCPIAGVICFYILGNVLSHARPPVILGYKFSCFPATRMAREACIMVCLDNVISQLGVKRDIYPVAVEDKTIFLSPLFPSEISRSPKFFESLYHFLISVCAVPDSIEEFVSFTSD